MQIMTRPCREPAMRLVARELLSRGLGSPGTIARCAGVSRQCVEGWVRDIDWQRIQRERFLRQWRRSLDRASKLVKG